MLVIVELRIVPSKVKGGKVMWKSSTTLLNSIPGNVAILNQEGIIIQVNDRWIEFNQQNNGQVSECNIGVNYLGVCYKAYQEGAEDGKQAAEGIKAVIVGEQEMFEFEYPCHSPEQQRWFNMRVTQLTESAPHIVAVYHFDITDRKLAEERAEYKTEQLMRRIEQARKVHQTLLPARSLDYGDLSAEIFYQPAEDLGGDFFNFHQVEDKVIFYVVDVSGHGLDGAMLNLLIQEKVENYLTSWAAKQENQDYYGYDWLLDDKPQEKHLCPREVIAQVQELYTRKDFPADYFLCIEVGVIDLSSWQLVYSNAGFHIPLFSISAEGEVSSLVSRGALISQAVPFDRRELDEKTVQLAAGSKLFFTTDGLIEIEDQTGRYGRDRLQKLLADNYYLDAQLLKEEIGEDMNQFQQNDEIHDDITFFVIEKKEADRFKTTVASDYAVLDSLKREVKNFLADKVTDFSPMLIGLHEMAANAIEHGNQFKEDKQVKVEVVVRPDYLRVAVEDEGDGFDCNSCVQQEIELEEFTDRGQGIFLTKKAVDEIHYNCQGNRVNLIKFRG